MRHDQISELIDELRQIDDSDADGQAKMYFHAGRALLLALEILRLKNKGQCHENNYIFCEFSKVKKIIIILKLI